jgi:hypothetical protein
MSSKTNSRDLKKNQIKVRNTQTFLTVYTRSNRYWISDFGTSSPIYFCPWKLRELAAVPSGPRNQMRSIVV